MNFIVKPTSFSCNMVCEYCFYLEKADFMSKEHEKCSFMSVENLYKFMEKRISSCSDKNITFIWQGGEPLLAGLDFYKEATRIGHELAKKYDKNIYHSIQTNGTLIDEEWAKFLHDEKILVGLSLDGDEELHNAYRKMRNNASSFAKAVIAIDLMKRYHVEFNTLTVVNNVNVKYPLRVYNFLKSLDVKFMQFIPVVEMDKDTNKNYMPSWIDEPDKEVKLTEFSVDPIEYGKFINTIFDEWIRNDVTKISVRLFDSLLQRFSGNQASLCVFMPQCGGENMVLEADGTIYQCDHFVYPDERFKLGNMLDLDMTSLQVSIDKWSKAKANVSSECEKCPWLALCNGGCPKHRFVKADKGGRKTYFCPAYKRIFEHVTPGMNLIMEFMDKKLPWEYLPIAVDKLYTDKIS